MRVIYGLAGPDGVVRYVGQTSSPEKRLRYHRSMGRSARRLPDLHHSPVHRWVGEVGAEAVTLTVLEECGDGEGYAREAYWTHQLKTLAQYGTGGFNRQNQGFHSSLPEVIGPVTPEFRR